MGMRAQSTTVDVSRAQIAGRFRNASVLAAAAASLIGLVVLVGGWWLDVAILRQPFADFSAMRAGTAFGLLACGIGVVAAGRAWPAWSMAVAGGVTGALGVSILGGYLAGQSKTKFEALFAVRLNMDEAIPGRIAVNTAVCFVLLGAGLLMLAAREADGLRQSLGMMVVLVAYAAIMGYLMSALAVAGQLTPDYTAMAPHTAVPMFLLGSGITLVSLQRGWGRIFAEPRAGGRALRLGVPVTLTVLLITGGLLTAIANVSGSDISAVEVLLVGLAALVILGMAVIASRIERMSSTIANYASDLDGQVAARMLDLRQATALLQSQFRESPNGIALLDVRGRLLDVNRALCDIVGYSKADLLALGMREISIPERHTHWMQRTQQAITQDGDGTDLVTRLLHRDGTEVWVHESIGVVHDDAGDPELLVCNFVNVSDTVKAQRALAEQEQLLRLILNNSAELIMRYDLDLRVVYVNQRVVEVTGVDYPEWIGKSFHTLGYPTEVADEWEANLRAVLESGSTLTFEYEIDNANGHRWYESTIAAERAESGSVTHAVSTSHDVTSRKLLELQLTELATRDELTGLANRAAMLGELTRALSAGGRSGRPTAVLMIDLDRFKNVNDSLGHAFGDLVLQEAARRLGDKVRGSDLVARQGGDEFVIVMRDLANVTEPMRAAERIVEAFRQPMSLQGTEIFTTASIGVTIASGVSFTDDIMREADTALYAAKNEGRDRVALYNEELRTAVTERLTLENDLRRAVERHEFLVYYQPEVDFATGAIVAVEALVRWKHPDGRLLQAYEFIETAEETGIIQEIGDWVLRESCVQAARWAQQRPDSPMVVRVNLSAVQLSSPTLMGTVDEALRNSHLDPSLLCFEITETALLRETATVRFNVVGIRDRGIHIAIDDFGTGFASLAYLRDYPVTALKIDRLFVMNMLTNDIDRRLIAGIIALAERFGVSVTAEGVEDEVQALHLQALGCPTAQGFLYSEAIPADALDALMSHTYAHS